MARPLADELLRMDGDEPEGWKLPAYFCRSCRTVFHPLKACCPQCGEAELDELVLRKSGLVLAYTTVHQTNASSLVPAPYEVALIKMDDGPIVEAIGQLDATASSRSGIRVKLIIDQVRSDAEDWSFYRFVPMPEEGPR